MITPRYAGNQGIPARGIGALFLFLLGCDALRVVFFFLAGT